MFGGDGWILWLGEGDDGNYTTHLPPLHDRCAHERSPACWCQPVAEQVPTGLPFLPEVQVYIHNVADPDRKGTTH